MLTTQLSTMHFAMVGSDNKNLWFVGSSIYFDDRNKASVRFGARYLPAPYRGVRGPFLRLCPHRQKKRPQGQWKCRQRQEEIWQQDNGSKDSGVKLSTQNTGGSKANNRLGMQQQQPRKRQHDT